MASRRVGRNSIAKFILHIGVIVLLATSAGLIRARGMPWIPDVEKLQEKQRRHQTLRDTAGISLERFQDLIGQGAVVIDARPREAYEEGHLRIDGIPAVINIPPDEIDANLNRLYDLAGLPVVLYCTSNECDMAEELYPILQQYGFTEIWIYFPGYAGILEAKLPTVAGPDSWVGYEEPMMNEDQPPNDDGSADLEPADGVEESETP